MNKIVSPEVVGAIADTLRESAAQPENASSSLPLHRRPIHRQRIHQPQASCSLLLIFFPIQACAFFSRCKAGSCGPTWLFGWPGIGRRSGYQCERRSCGGEVASASSYSDDLAYVPGGIARGCASARDAQLCAAVNPLRTSYFLGP